LRHAPGGSDLLPKSSLLLPLLALHLLLGLLRDAAGAVLEALPLRRGVQAWYPLAQRGRCLL
jgi:hypothetical protein